MKQKKTVVILLCMAVLCVGLFSQTVFSVPAFQNMLRETSNSYFQIFDSRQERADRCTIEGIRDQRSFTLQTNYQKETFPKTERPIRTGFVALLLILLSFGRFVFGQVKEKQDNLLPPSIVFFSA